MERVTAVVNGGREGSYVLGTKRITFARLLLASNDPVEDYPGWFRGIAAYVSIRHC